MEPIYRLVRKVPPTVELIFGVLLIVAGLYFNQLLFMAAALLWLALDAASEGLRLRAFGFLVAMAAVVIYATITLPTPPPYHPSTPA